MQKQVNAVVIVLATPLNRDGSLDLPGLRANVRFLVDRCKGKRFIFVPTGSTGEFYALSDAERLKVIETVIETTAGAVPVVAGTPAAGTSQTIYLSKEAEKAGADGVQVVLPFYHVPSEEGLYRHYMQLADSLNIAVMIYNNSATSKLWMPPHIMARCSEHPNIVADKENVADVEMWRAMRNALDPAKMRILCGLGDLHFSYQAALGCDGFVTWTANFVPELSLALLEAADACDFQTVRKVVAKTARLYDFAGECAVARGRDPWVMPGFTSGHIYIAVMKAALEMVGLAGGPVRGPGDDLTAAERSKLFDILAEIGAPVIAQAQAASAPGRTA